ncbi:MAG: hypothetical protein ACOY3P_11585 [Planctomycetota bacterium]
MATERVATVTPVTETATLAAAMDMRMPATGTGRVMSILSSCTAA